MIVNKRIIPMPMPMTEITKDNLTGMSLQQLAALSSLVATATAEVRVNARRLAIVEAAEVALRHGFTLEELFGAVPEPKKQRKSPAPKYQHPHDPSVNWNGLGRHPNWVKACLAEGRSLESLLIGFSTASSTASSTTLAA